MTTVCFEEPCTIELGLPEETVGTGYAASPLPLSATVCGLSKALSLIVSIPVDNPTVRGWKKTVITQLLPGWTGMVHPFLAVNADPLTATDEIARVSSPWLKTKTGVPRPLFPTSWSSAWSIVGDRWTT